MKKALVISAVAVVALMAARPGSEQQLVQQLNGQPSRWVMPDAGRSGVFTLYDAGTANNRGCMPLTGATNSAGASVSPNVLVFVPLVPVNVCIRPSVFSPVWDGGCTTLPQDENYGLPLPVGVPQYLTPDTSARSLCFVTDGGYLSVPVWTAQ